MLSLNLLPQLLIFTACAHAASLDKDFVRSDSRILRGRPLSDTARREDDGFEYDHDAFLGDDLSSQFDALSPEESLRRLKIILGRIDSNGDGFIDQDELQTWIRNVQEKEMREDTQKMWEEKVAEGKDKISWTEYRNVTYGSLENVENSFPIGFNFSGMIHRDERRFSMSDKDGDKELDRDEFSAFVHPEDHAYMRDIVVIETMDDMDKDKDGKISLKEYIEDFWQMYDTTAPEIEPEWVQDEREQFSLHKDTDKDGYLSFQEMKHWLVPEDFDHSWAEAHHLLSTVDADQDQKLSQEEILEKYDIFVGSQATQFGEMLNRHDEF